jgi:hypothetical protein
MQKFVLINLGRIEFDQGCDTWLLIENNDFIGLRFFHIYYWWEQIEHKFSVQRFLRELFLGLNFFIFASP